ncbi:MAG: hypothetical protein RIT14_1522 [Pseudomonadota bacterium]|jgi:16S rRNA (cytosine967-C5)-methyltransferase
MTPAARMQAAIEVLDRVLAGANAEMVLTNWGRANRYAGSGDRAAVRDIVYDALRCRRSFAALGGAETGRGLVLGGLRDAGRDPAEWFTGLGHAPVALTEGEEGRVPEGAEALDCPAWLEAELRDSLGAEFAPVLAALRRRAPVFLRVNLARTTRAAAVAALAAEGVEAVAHPLAASALEVVAGARRVAQTRTWAEGLVELQDAASQAVVEMLPLQPGMRVLDLCAGGGGKTLAMAGRARLDLYAHDAEPRRMADLPARAERAGVAVQRIERPEARAPYDLVLTDVPCSGSGSWRRDPQGKWALTAKRLAALQVLQAEIMDRAAAMVAPGGILAYATCSLLARENGAQVADFLVRHSGWRQEAARRFTPLDGGDGFFGAVLRRG